MWGENFRWHFDYVRLAWDTGFNFEKHKHCNFDKSKISLVDIEKIIQERDIATVDRNISTVIHYVLDNEQALVLDTNFVKMFRICQLAVEYLLFCKKYLDNTTVLLKKELKELKEENKELKEYNSELERHINSLTKKISEQNASETFKCTKCSKLFSSEFYLQSHIKRRHEVFDDNSTQSEADKLQTEIKNLKERLNETEKLINNKNQIEETSNEKNNIEQHSKVVEIQENFERFKQQVESELKILQMQKNFYEEKYGKLIDVVSDTIISKHLNSDNKVEVVDTPTKVVQTTDITTQTEAVKNNLKVELVQDKNVFEYKHQSAELQDVNDEKEKLEETIELKVTQGLEKIETQMLSFLSKLNEFGQNRLDIPQETKEESPTKPAIKPRSIFTASKQPKPVVEPEKLEALEIESEESEESTVSSTDTESRSIVELKKSQSTTLTSIKRVVDRKEILENFKGEIENVLQQKLQDIGINPEWKGIPHKSFERALEIINHQASLIKKNCPEFTNIRASVEKDLEKSVPKKTKPVKKKTRNNQQILNISVQKKQNNNSITTVKTTPAVTIKNRSLYATDTDSETENVSPSKPTTAVLHSEMIKELKTVLPKQAKSEQDDQTKGVLKTFSSVSSLSKKKVNFDIATDSDSEEQIAFVTKTGSTDSVTSSVFDEETKETGNEKGKEKKGGDESDFDFSDV